MCHRIDWQQGGTTGNATGGKENPTIWLNKVRATDNIRKGSSTREFVLARWGGLGNHRYQVGFSGDVATVNWCVCAVARAGGACVACPPSQTRRGRGGANAARVHARTPRP